MKRKRIAIIGSREPRESQVTFARSAAGSALARGWDIATGAAEGIDLIAMETAEFMCLSPRLHIYLPWNTYNKHLIPSGANVYTYSYKNKDWAESVSKYHPSGGRLSQGAFKMMARNYGIVINSDVVLAMPSAKLGGGGTGQGIRIAAALDIPLYVIEREEALPESLSKILRDD